MGKELVSRGGGGQGDKDLVEEYMVGLFRV